MNAGKRLDAPVGKADINTSHEHAVRRYYDLVDNERYAELFELFSEDVVYERGGIEPIVGIESFKRFYHAERIIESGRHEVETLISDGDWVVARGTFFGTLKTGVQVTVRWADFHQFRGDRICRRYTYFSDRAV